ncbi:MAG TPA: aspartyl/asparaginyl beta-hydroxylase domain-containing protein [Chitinophagaceae bacterium]|nr:aspartyl/asparaginyl beta-hydroxylase domain-containing protein [Chitinophagaceae bacterium]
MISHARLPLNPPIHKWQAEIDALTENWTEHFNKNYFEGQWTVISLRSPGGRSGQIIPDAIGDKEYADTPLLNDCPSIRSWLTELQCPLLSVRLLNLRSHSIIKEHRDHELSFEKGEARLHVPVFTNPFVEFHLNNELLMMNEGECWYINANLLHRVANNGPADRIHLVLDCVVNDWLKSIFEKSECINVPEEQFDDENRKIISELRRSNTEVANRLADELESKMKTRLS